MAPDCKSTHSTLSVFLCYVLRADQITNYCMMQYGRVSMYRTSTLLDHPFQYHHYSPLWLVLMKTAWLAGCCPHPPFLLYVMQCTFILLMYSALSELFCFSLKVNSNSLLSYFMLQLLYFASSVSVMNMKNLLYPERAFSCMMHAMLLLMICTSCYIIFTHYMLYSITLDTWHFFCLSISWT